MIEKIFVPDVGEAQDIEVIEVLVAVGDEIEVNTSVVVLESDKASMEIPSTFAGIINAIAVKEGDKVVEGSLLLEIRTEAEDKQVAKEALAAESDRASAVSSEAPSEAPSKEIELVDKASTPPAGIQKIETSKIVTVPDVGDIDKVVVVEILVHQGDVVNEGDSIVVLESDKASMEIPADMSGVVLEIFVNEGDEVAEGDPLATLVGQVEVDDSTDDQKTVPEGGGTRAIDSSSEKPLSNSPAQRPDNLPAKVADLNENDVQSDSVHAGPAVRKQAREYGVDLSLLKGSGRSGRVVKDDIQAYVKAQLSRPLDSSGSGSIPAMPEVDFSKWGEVEERPLSRIRKASAKNLHRSWLNVPHVTQFDEADITELELFRAAQNKELVQSGSKVTPLAFLIRAVVNALVTYPQFNASIASNLDHLVIKKYYNIGIAVETADGLMVPVLKDADKKGVVQLAAESAELAAQARDKKLSMDAMQGATFTISSLGGIGGTAFTPIVNAPEVAILGVSRAKVTPVYVNGELVPRTMLPLSLSYDHRAIDGAEAARFTTHLSKVLGDIRRVLM